MTLQMRDDGGWNWITSGEDEERQDIQEAKSTGLNEN